MRYALINRHDTVVEVREWPEPPPDPIGKAMRWRPLQVERPALKDGEIHDRVDRIVEADRVVDRHTVRVLTPAERAAGVAAVRRLAYPPLHEQVEALMEHAAGRPEALAAMLARIDEVKRTYPKPSEVER